MIKKTILIVFTVFFVLLNQSVKSQKIAVINLDYIINNCHQYQEIIKKISNKYFYFKDKGFFYLKVGKFKVILLNKVSIDNLEIITMNANNLITCHGPLSQISGSFNVNLMDIIDRSQKKWYFRHTSHIKKYHKFYRENFSKLSNKIILKIK